MDGRVVNLLLSQERVNKVAGKVGKVVRLSYPQIKFRSPDGRVCGILKPGFQLTSMSVRFGGNGGRLRSILTPAKNL